MPKQTTGAKCLSAWRLHWKRAAVAAVTGLAVALGGHPADAAPAPVVAGAVPAAKVMVIAEENHTYGQIIGSAAAPYLNQLAGAYRSVATVDAGYPTRCPSLAAYILMTSGSTHGICDDQGLRHHQLTGDNIFAQVAAAGLRWRNYAEAAPTACAGTNSADDVFLVRHTPAPYYVSEQRRCHADDVALGTPAHGALHHDVVSGTLPAYAYVSPDACHDMHGAAACRGDEVRTGDSWLRQWLPQILGGPDFRAGRLLVIITWDEGSATSNHIPLLLISPHPVALAAGVRYTHCSTLATAEAVLHLPRLGCAATAAPFATHP